MMNTEKIVHLALPEFAFVEGSGHENPNMLEGRDVILHVRSASVMEVFERENTRLNPDTLTHEFINTNQLGAKEYMVIALHYSATLDKDADREMLLQDVLKPAARWYCDYCDWEDRNIIEEDG